MDIIKELLRKIEKNTKEINENMIKTARTMKKWQEQDPKHHKEENNLIKRTMYKIK